MPRTALIATSVLAHAAVCAALFANGIWKLERVEARSVPHYIAQIPLNPPGESAPIKGAVQQDPNDKKRPKEKVTNTQPPTHPQEPQVGETSGKTGTGGKGTEVTECTSDCGPPERESVTVCGNGAREIGEQCDDGNTNAGDGCSATCQIEPPKPPPPPKTIGKDVLAALRTSGETQILPSSSTQSEMMRDGMETTRGTVKLCLSAQGAVTSATTLISTKYSDYDRALLSAVRGWRYRPYTVDGAAVPACSIVSFVFTLRR